MRSPRATIVVQTLAVGLGLLGTLCRPAEAQQQTKASAAVPSQALPASEIDEDLARQKQIVDRFLAVLERNPRRGTALDRIYGFHVENGTIEDFAKELRQRVADKADDGTGWMLLGLIESQRGRDAAAVEALTKAKDLRPTDALASFYLGQALVLVGQPDKAVAAFEETIQRKPQQADLLEVFQALGRVHQRAQRTQEALEVWTRLEKLFPGDAHVQEHIALALVEEGQYAEALPRYESLAGGTADDYRKTVYRMDAAELKIKLNRSAEAIADFEQLLARLNPESWLFREVRRKIEEIFLKTDDQDGLAKYYTAWIAKNSEDIEAMARLARVLARQARVPEAQEWLDKALKLAPSRKELRLAFIEQLVDDQRYAEAIQQYAELDKVDPNNPDYLRDWGKLVLKDASRQKTERQLEAEKIWRRLIAARPTDALIATQVADLFRQADLQPQALELYQKAVELAPKQPQYREYLGEYYHILKRTDEALATWRKMAEGDQPAATNVARLAEVFVQFGYLDEGLAEIAAACELDPKDYALHLKAADFAIRAEKFDTALVSLAKAENLAQNDEEREAVLNQQIKTHTLQNKLSDLAAELAAKAASAHDFFLLARYREALHEYPEATRAINEAIQLQANNVPSLAAAARIAEQSGDLKTSADLNRRLAVVDRRGRTEYLQRVASLETQLGRVDEALAAGRELIASAPGNTETYQFFADLCFRLNRVEDGLTALRRATRVNPNENSLLLALGAALTGQFRTDEAIELYWQAFDKEKDLDGKLSVIGKLTELYLQINRFDQLLERLERGRREADLRRQMTICLAQAYQSAGDYGMARQELERLLAENTRDTQLLLQLSKLAEGESDLATAIKHQEQLAKLAPGPETEYRLATLLARSGDNQEAANIFVRLAAKEEDKEKSLRNIDSLLTGAQDDTALAVIEPRLRENPNDWELLYRQGVAFAKRRGQEAAHSFQAILDLNLPDEELSTAAKNRQKNQRTSTVPGSISTALSARGQPGRTWRLNYSFEIRRAIGIDRDPFAYGVQTGRQAVWTPQDFAQARMAAVGWLYRLAQDASQGDELVAEWKQRAQDPAASARQMWDFVYLQSVRSDEEGQLDVSRRLAERGGPQEKLLYIMKLMSRSGRTSPYDNDPENDDKTPPLPPADLDLAIKCYDDIRRMSPDSQSDTQAYARAATQTILRELARAGRKDEERRLSEEAIGKATTVAELTTAMQISYQRRDWATWIALFDRLAQKDLQTPEQRQATPGLAREPTAMMIAEFQGKADIPNEDRLKMLDRYLAYHAAKVNQRRSSLTYRPPARAPQQQRSYATVWVGRQQRNIALTFPLPGEYFDQQSLSVLRTAFETFKSNDLASDLVKHVQQHAAAAPDAEKLFALLSLCYVQVWNEDRESAVASLNEAAAIAPQDLTLRLDQAQLNLEMQQLDEALAVVDSIAPLDQRIMQQRETMALDLAVRLGDHQRARDAAQRLFGLRLDAETQVNLAGQMRRLGMNEESEAVLARAQRQAGSRLSALAALMGQYQAQGQMEVAAQVAHQILRRSRTAPAAQVAMGYSTSDSQYRTSALACLAQAGKLKELIAGLEDQIKRSPQSSQLYETLSEYFQAAGETQKMLDLQAKIVELRPDDAELRYRYATELYRRGKVNEACEQYLQVIKKQPQLIARRYFEVTQAFQRAKKDEQLIQALAEIDLKKLGQPYVVTNMLRNTMRSQAGKNSGMALFRKAWEAFPDQRSELMSNFYDASMWKLPEVLDYGKQALFPTGEAVRRSRWHALDDLMGWDNEGKIETVVGYVLDGLSKTNQLAKFRDEIAAELPKYPQWQAGPLLVAIMDVRLGKQVNNLTSLVEPLLAPSQRDYQLLYAQWTVAQELEAKPAFQPVAIKLLERATTSDDAFMNGFDLSPARRLVHLYKNDGQREEARKVLVREAVREVRDDGNYNYRMGRHLESMMGIGRLLTEMDFPVDAFRVYREVLVNPRYSDPTISQYIGRTPDQFQGQARQAMQAVLKKIEKSPSGEMAAAFLVPAPTSRPGEGVLDLMISATPAAGSALPSLESPLATLIRPAAFSAAAISRVEKQLSSLSAEHPNDFSVAIAGALFALRGNDEAKTATALAHLQALLLQTPLEALPAGKRPNSRQRAEAQQQIGLWLVARECLRTAEQRALAEQFSERAVAAAQRQLEPEQLTAILYERGRLALEARDAALAQKMWSELIELALVQPRLPKPGAPTAGSGAGGNAVPGVVRSFGRPSAIAPAAPQRVLPAAPIGPAPTINRASPTNLAPPLNTAARRTGKMPATLSQFKLGASISQGAAEQGLPELSLRAIREALSGGLPVPDLPKAGGDSLSATRVVRAGPAGLAGGANRPDIDQTVFSELSTRMWQLSLVWKRKGFEPVEVCKLLEEIVFPAARPGDVVIYEQPLNNDLSNPQSVGRLLVEWAQRADRVGELQQQIAARQATPSDVVAGEVLLVQLHVSRGELQSARDRLQKIATLIESSKLTSLVALAAHATAAALQDSQLISAATPLLEKLATAPAQQSRGFVSSGTPGRYSPQTILTREHLRAGNAAAALSQIDRYLQSRQEFYARYIGDSGLSYQRRDLAWAANEVARGGDLAATLAALARYADVTVVRDREAPPSVALWHLERQARQLSAEDRYHRLRDWTLPANDRRSVRAVAAFDSGQPIPTIFFDASAANSAYQPEPSYAPLSNLALLVEAAGETGRLDELLAVVDPLAKEKVPGAEALALMTLIAKRDFPSATLRLEALAKALRQVVPPQLDRQNPPPPLEPGNHLATRAALLTPELADAGQKVAKILLDQARRTYHREYITHLGRDLTLPALSDSSPAEREQAVTPSLKLWTATGAHGAESTLPPALWSLCEGHLMHHTGPEYDALYFNYPLTGEFEFSYDAFRAYFAQSELGYGGIVCQPIYNGGQVTIASTSQHDSINRPAMPESNNGWNHVSVKVSPDKVRFYVNGHLAYEDRSPGRTSPWLEVHAKDERQPVLKNFRLTRAPMIAREVRLIEGDRLDGWNAQFYGEKMPTRLKSSEPPSTRAAEQSYYVLNAAGDYVLYDPSAPVVFDWNVNDGVLEGRYDGLAGTRSASRLFYQRPMADGERVSYQFFYEPGELHVHPTLGRLAFLLEPEGLKLHWMTAATDAAESIVLDARNAVDEPSSRRGSALLPLKPGNWNEVELSIRRGQASIRLNGELICERPIEPTSDRRFGLFHYKGQTAVQVREMVLRGDWPQALSPADQNDLLAVSTDSGPVARARHALVGERFLADAAYDVWKESADLPPQARYAYLKRWVLPSESHPTVRMRMDWTPTDPRPTGPLNGARHTGGELVAPALALVETAKELNKLDELATAAAFAGKEFPDQARELCSLEALVAIARGDDPTAIARLKQAQEYVKARPKETPTYERHAEIMAGYFAISRPSLLPTVLALAETIVADQNGNRRLNDEWSQRVMRLRALTKAAIDSRSGLSHAHTLPLSQWHVANRAGAPGRGQGFSPPMWQTRPGEVTYRTGNGHNSLYFAAPLVGDFELRCQRQATTWRGLLPMYGGVAFDFDLAKNTSIKHEAGRAGAAGVALAKPFKVSGSVDFRLVVKNGVMTQYVNGEQVLSEQLYPGADPWLAFASRAPGATDVIRKVQILGNPQIPRELRLSTGSDLAGWSGEYYSEPLGKSDGASADEENTNTNWRKSGEEIVAGKLNNSPGSFRESVLQYHRPLLEDGELEYEFYYEPEKTMTHPAIDRLVFLLEPEGTKIHWLTDKNWDRTGADPDNAEPLPGAKPVPLKPGEWNKLKLTLRGDEVALAVNGEEVARRTLESNNQRVFGLFHYKDASAVRVRGVIHRGNWLTELPPVEKQELAVTPQPLAGKKGKPKSK